MSEVRLRLGLGLTLPIPGINYGMVRPEIVIDGIDPEGDVSAQVTEALGGASVGLEMISAQLAKDVASLTPPERIAELEATIGRVDERLGQVVIRLRERFAALETAIGVTAQETAPSG